MLGCRRCLRKSTFQNIQVLGCYVVQTVNNGPKWSRTIQTVQNLPKTDLNSPNGPKPEISEFQIMMYSNFHFPSNCFSNPDKS